jgi:hypothetical protein
MLVAARMSKLEKALVQKALAGGLEKAELPCPGHPAGAL